MSRSPGPSAVPSSSSSGPANRHAPTPVERQRAQLDKLLKDPLKPAYVPTPPKEKTIRPPREMMKNVQGSSAGAGSGEFHVYKASRRREYERLKMMDDEAQKESDTAAFEAKKRQWEEEAEAKTAKNRAKRQKKKEKSKGKGSDKHEGSAGKQASATSGDAPLKKRRLVNGQELVFRRPGEESDGEDGDDEPGPTPLVSEQSISKPTDYHHPEAPVIEASRITIHEED